MSSSSPGFPSYVIIAIRGNGSAKSMIELEDVSPTSKGGGLYCSRLQHHQYSWLSHLTVFIKPHARQRWLHVCEKRDGIENALFSWLGLRRNGVTVVKVMICGEVRFRK